LFLIAIVNLFTKPVATVAGGAFSILLYIGLRFPSGEAIMGGARAWRWTSSILPGSELTPEGVGARREYSGCQSATTTRFYHLGNVLDRIKPGRRDIVVLHIRLLRRSASGENELDATSSSAASNSIFFPRR